MRERKRVGDRERKRGREEEREEEVERKLGRKKGRGGEKVNERENGKEKERVREREREKMRQEENERKVNVCELQFSALFKSKHVFIYFNLDKYCLNKVVQKYKICLYKYINIIHQI
jgi:hypothetical protein